MLSTKYIENYYITKYVILKESNIVILCIIYVYTPTIVPKITDTTKGIWVSLERQNGACEERLSTRSFWRDPLLPLSHHIPVTKVRNILQKPIDLGTPFSKDSSSNCFNKFIITFIFCFNKGVIYINRRIWRQSSRSWLQSWSRNLFYPGDTRDLPCTYFVSFTKRQLWFICPRM